jgi:pimeloyl-ACP methyl ester carboxylesterase
MKPLLAVVLALPLGAASVDGIQLHSSTSGKGPRTVILVHGWTCDETTWASQVPALSKDYRVITLDLPGHGKSGSPQDGKFSMDLFARAVEAVRAEAKADRVVLVGHSMGTPVVVQYARLYPQHTAALVFVDGIVWYDPTNPNVPRPEFWAGPQGQANREKIIRNMFSPATQPDVQKHILSMMLAPPEATAVGAMAATYDPAIWTRDKLTLPILGIYAGDGRMANRPYMNEHYPAHEYIQMPGTGHFLMLEKPEEFNRLLLTFLNKLNP